MSYEHYVGFIFCGIAVLQFVIFWINEWRRIYEGLRGQDNLWQAIELIMHAAIIIWPCMLMADTFFGFKASSEAWDSINIVVVAGILGISYKSYLSSKEPKTEDKPPAL